MSTANCANRPEIKASDLSLMISKSSATVHNIYRQKYLHFIFLSNVQMRSASRNEHIIREKGNFFLKINGLTKSYKMVAKYLDDVTSNIQ